MDRIIELVLGQLGQRADLALFIAGVTGGFAPYVTEHLKAWLPLRMELPPRTAHRLFGAAVLLLAWLALGTGQWWAWGIVGAAGSYISEHGYRVGRKSYRIRLPR